MARGIQGLSGSCIRDEESLLEEGRGKGMKRRDPGLSDTPLKLWHINDDRAQRGVLDSLRFRTYIHRYGHVSLTVYIPRQWDRRFLRSTVTHGRIRLRQEVEKDIPATQDSGMPNTQPRHV